MEFKEISKDKIDAIHSITSGSPNFASTSPWFSIYPCKPEDIFDNPTLLNKVIATAIVVSGAALYSCDVVRKQGEIYDVDRHLLLNSGAAILMRKEIEKDFPEHHSPTIPSHYT